MSNEKSFLKSTGVALYKFVDVKQPEVKWTILTTILVEVLLILIKFHSNFSIYEDELCSLFQGVIGALVSLIGVAISGVAIVIVLFTREQVDIMETIKAGAFESLLNDFKWMALVSALDTALFVGMIFIVRSPYPLVGKCVFYILAFLLMYSFFYLLFYGCALIGNCIRLYGLKNKLEVLSEQKKSAPERAIEFQLDFLIAKLLKGDKEEARKFYAELISLAEKSSDKSKNEILDYLNERYAIHTKKD